MLIIRLYSSAYSNFFRT